MSSAWQLGGESGRVMCLRQAGVAMDVVVPERVRDGLDLCVQGGGRRGFGPGGMDGAAACWR